MVRADREKLQQILFNLLSNAIKFTPSGGRITVEAGATDGEPIATVKVTDNGDGIPAAKLESIFEPFVQLGARPASIAGGLGLGPSISRDLARGMVGSVRRQRTRRRVMFVSFSAESVGNLTWTPQATAPVTSHPRLFH